MSIKKRTSIILSTVAIGMILAGCGSDTSSESSTSLTQELKDSLAYMGNEERLAYDVYMNLYNYHQENNNLEIPQLYNIATNSETKHISIVQDLVKKYDINVSQLSNVDETVINNNTLSSTNMVSGVYDIQKIQDLYDMLYARGVSSWQDALEVGCMVEVTDVNDLDGYIQQAQASNASDVQSAFETLRSGSYNHYWSFDAGLKNMGISDGCCGLGEEYCHPEYPQNEQGQGNGNQRGRQ